MNKLNKKYSFKGFGNEYLKLNQFKKSTNLWKFQQHVKLITPLKLKVKIPFKQMVIDIENNCFMYHFEEGNTKPIYSFLYQLFQNAE